jgi:DNA-directed RNA polymerase specialized sigma24 family protein
MDKSANAPQPPPDGHSHAHRDPAIVAHLYRTLGPSIRRYVDAKWPKASGEDVVQEVFRRFIEASEQSSAYPSVEAHLFGIARNVARESTRASRRPFGITGNTADPCLPPSHGTDGLESHEQANLLARAKLILSGNQLQAIALVYDRQMAPRAAAVVAGCTEKALRRRIEEGRRKLYEFLAARLPLFSVWAGARQARRVAVSAPREPMAGLRGLWRPKAQLLAKLLATAITAGAILPTEGPHRIPSRTDSTVARRPVPRFFSPAGATVGDDAAADLRAGVEAVGTESQP